MADLLHVLFELAELVLYVTAIAAEVKLSFLLADYIVRIMRKALKGVGLHDILARALLIVRIFLEI